MNVKNPSLARLLALGFGAGVVIAAIDNFAFGGEISPIAIVALLLLLNGTAGATWGWRGGLLAIPAWLCIPSAHLIKQGLGLPDTLHPNTFTSILLLALFTFLVSTIGIALGVLLRRMGKPA